MCGEIFHLLTIAMKPWLISKSSVYCDVYLRASRNLVLSIQRRARERTAISRLWVKLRWPRRMVALLAAFSKMPLWIQSVRLLDRLLHFTSMVRFRRDVDNWHKISLLLKAFCVVHSAYKIPYMGLALLIKQMYSETDMPVPHPVNTYTFHPPHFPSHHHLNVLRFHR